MTSSATPTDGKPTEPAPAPTKRAPRFRGRNLVLMTILGVILVAVVAFGLWAWASLGYTYSNGERTGYVQRLAHTGWLCKTWEGELMTTPVAGGPPQAFDFTIRSDSLAHALELVSGRKVTLSYAEHKGVPSSCFGETQYFIESFRAAGAPGAAGAAEAP